MRPSSQLVESIEGNGYDTADRQSNRSDHEDEASPDLKWNSGNPGEIPCKPSTTSPSEVGKRPTTNAKMEEVNVPHAHGIDPRCPKISPHVQKPHTINKAKGQLVLETGNESSNHRSDRRDPTTTTGCTGRGDNEVAEDKVPTQSFTGDCMAHRRESGRRSLLDFSQIRSYTLKRANHESDSPVYQRTMNAPWEGR